MQLRELNFAKSRRPCVYRRIPQEFRKQFRIRVRNALALRDRKRTNRHVAALQHRTFILVRRRFSTRTRAFRVHSRSDRDRENAVGRKARASRLWTPFIANREYTGRYGEHVTSHTQLHICRGRHLPSQPSEVRGIWERRSCILLHLSPPGDTF